MLLFAVAFSVQIDAIGLGGSAIWRGNGKRTVSKGKPHKVYQLMIIVSAIFKFYF